MALILQKLHRLVSPNPSRITQKKICRHKPLYESECIMHVDTNGGAVLSHSNNDNKSIETLPAVRCIRCGRYDIAQLRRLRNHSMCGRWQESLGITWPHKIGQITWNSIRRRMHFMGMHDRIATEILTTNTCTDAKPISPRSCIRLHHVQTMTTAVKRKLQ